MATPDAVGSVHHVPSTTWEDTVAAPKSYGSKPDATHAKGKTYPGGKTTAKLKAEGKITSGGNYDKGEPIVFPDDK